MGILNMTPDSFSDGGRHASLGAAIAHAKEMVKCGAQIIDVGGESTRPGSNEVSVAEERARIIPIIKELAGLNIAVSVDTRHADVAAAAIEAGAIIVNDINGMRDPAMVDVVAASDVGVCSMHMQGEPKSMQDSPHYNDVVKEVREFLEEMAAKLEARGITKDRICADPGFGFGKTFEHNRTLFARLDELRSDEPYPMLVGISRKRFIQELSGVTLPLGRDILDQATGELSAASALRGGHILRVHNVEACARALQKQKGAARRVYIALGSNMGNSIARLKEATARIKALPGTSAIRASSIVVSKAAYLKEQPDFYNAVLELDTHLGVFALFNELQHIETLMGRTREVENGPRVIDIDLLSYEQERIDTPKLTLPHKAMGERAFVVEPLASLGVKVEDLGATRESFLTGEIKEMITHTDLTIL